MIPLIHTRLRLYSKGRARSSRTTVGDTAPRKLGVCATISLQWTIFRLVFCGMATIAAIGCQPSPLKQAIVPRSAFPAPPSMQEGKVGTVGVSPAAVSRNLPTSQPDTAAILRGIAEAVTATDFCPELMPNWPLMSVFATNHGVDVETAETRAALDAKSQYVTSVMVEQRRGTTCSNARDKYGPAGSLFPGFLIAR
jgi:hypothetical protein